LELHMSTRVIIIGVLLLLGLGLWGRNHLSGSQVAEREREVGASPTYAPEPVQRTGSARVHPPIVTGALRLEGLVLDDEERPRGGVRVTLDGARTARTEADGSFAFDDLAPRDYTLIAELDDWYGEETDATLDDTSEPVTIAMTRGPTIRVRVVGQTGSPVAGARIWTTSRDVISDATGLGIVRGADTGTEQVRVSVVGHAPADVRVVTGDDPSAIIEQTVVVVAGAPLTGTVVDEAGALVLDAMIEIEALNGDRVEAVGTDGTGVWTSENIAAGRYLLRGSSDAHIPTRDLVVQHAGVTRKGGLVVRVARGAEVIGFVIDGQRKPVQGAEVAIGPRRGTTGADGRFVAAGLDPDSYDAVATTKDAASNSLSVIVKPNGRHEIELVLHASSLAGIVVDQAGQPIDGVAVYARSTDPNGIGYGYSDERGRFDLGGVPPGTYDIEAQRPEQTSRIPGATARVPSGTRALRIVLPELGSITARVVHDGVPVPYFGISVSAPDQSIDSQSPRAVREATGTFLERGLTAGTWNVAIVGPGFDRKVIENVRLISGETLQLGDIVVGEGALLHGRVVDGRGRGVEGAHVVVLTDGSSSDDDRLRALMAGTYSATTDARGAFRIDGMRASDRRRVVATHPQHGVSGEQDLAADQREIQLLLHPTGSLGGTLANLTPEVRGVRASLVDGPGGLTFADVDRAGRFEIANLPVGVYEVRVHGHVIMAPQKIAVVAGARTELDFELPVQPVTVTVQVTGTCSLVWLHTRGSSETLESESCRSGTATFRGVAPGSYDLCIEDTDCHPVEVPAQPALTVQLAAQS